MRRPILTSLLASLTLGGHALAHTTSETLLSPEERIIARAADGENARTLALLQRIVDINSGTMNFAGVRRVADVLRGELDSLGFTTKWIDGASFHRAGHLVAEHAGPGPKLLLIGHLDTVFEPSSPFQRFERLDDSTTRGPGVIDMKGGDVIIIAALSEFYKQLSGERYLTFNPGLALGGTLVRLDSMGVAGSAEGKSNVVAERMTVVGDLRTISPEQLARAKQTMQAIVATHLPNTTGELTFDAGYPPMAPTAGNRRLLAVYDRVSRDLGLWPVTAVDPSKAGAADVSFVANIVPMKIDGVGLSGRDDHTTKETADLRMLPVQTKRAALLLYRLTTRTPETSGR